MLKNSLRIEEFPVVKRKCYYVDKTRFLVPIIHAPKSTAFLFIRPRGFGKSLALSMVETFYALVEDCSDCFAGTFVEAEEGLFQQERNTRPVLHLNFKRSKGKDYQDFLDLLRFDMAVLTRKVCEKYDLPLEGKIKALAEERADETLLKTSLDRLLRYVHERLGVEPLVLIDEYDCPLDKAYRAGYYEEAQTFLKVFLGDVLKGNQHLYRAVITGVAQIAHSSIFPDLNNLRVNSVLSSSGEEFFGFTRKETEDLLTYFGSTANIDEVTKWYGGYRFQGFSVYNPWSILSFVNNASLFNVYWANTGSNALLRLAVRRLTSDSKEELRKLIDGESVSALVDDNIVFGEESKGLYTLLIHSGYLKANFLLPPNRYSVSVPNMEIAYCLNQEILRMNDDASLLETLVGFKEAFQNGDDERIQNVLSRYVLACFSYYDLVTEKIYQIIVVTLMAMLFEDAIVKSEVNEGDGRCDIYVRGKGERSFAFVLEIKYRKGKKSRAELSSSAVIALKQILKKNYCEDALREGNGPVLAYGMAFSAKEVAVSSRKLR